MTLSEFKAWFEGFTELMSGPPTADQWKRIKKRVREIDGEWTPRHIFVDRYVHPYRTWRGSTSISDPVVLEVDSDAWRMAGSAEYSSGVDSAAAP